MPEIILDATQMKFSIDEATVQLSESFDGPFQVVAFVLPQRANKSHHTTIIGFLDGYEHYELGA